MRVRGLLVVFVVVLGLAATTALLGVLIPGPGSETPRIAVDRDRPPPAVAALPSGTDPAAWAPATARATGIPERSLQAYATAELRQRRITPGCRLSWTTLAGIGSIESRHGRLGGGRPDADGRIDPPIIGIPLDGTDGTRRVADTDGGRFDGDPVLDRAVGPMQFLPQTWERYAADGNGDGIAEPQQIDDAALTAAGYLCARDRDLADGRDWWSAVLAYNASGRYASDVWRAAADYASNVRPQ